MMVHDYSQSTAVLNDNDRLVVVMIDSLKLALAFDDVVDDVDDDLSSSVTAPESNFNI